MAELPVIHLNRAAYERIWQQVCVTLAVADPEALPYRSPPVPVVERVEVEAATCQAKRRCDACGAGETCPRSTVRTERQAMSHYLTD